MPSHHEPTRAHGTVFGDVNGNGSWPGIVSRFQLVLLAGHRSKQLYKGAQPRIPTDPLKKRNTSIALEELRRGLVTFSGLKTIDSQVIPASIDSIDSTANVLVKA